MIARIARDLAVIHALGFRDLQVAWSYRIGFLFSQAGPISAVLLFYFISRVVGESELVGSPEEYFQFVVIGLALGMVVEETASAAADSARAAQVEGTLEALAVQPVTPFALALGWTAYPVLDSFLRAIVTVLVALPLGLAGATPNWPATLVVLGLSAVVFAGVGIIGSALVIAFQQGASAVQAVMALIAVFSGTLFPVSVLPDWLEALTVLSPLTHALDAVRAAAIDGANLADIADELVILVGFAAVLLPLGALMITIALRHARRVGGLGKF